MKCTFWHLFGAAVITLGCGNDKPNSNPLELPFEIQPSLPEGCVENQNLARLLPVLTGGKTHPTGRGEHGAVYEHCHDRIVLFGGNDYQPEECADFGPKQFSGETWIYSLEHENWVRITSSEAPSPRGRHDMVFDSRQKRVLLFGGRYRALDAAGQAPYELFNDLWAFDVNEDQWTELQTSGEKPSPRTNSAMVYDEVTNQILVFGGSTSTSGLAFRPQNDTYLLDLSTLVWRRLLGDGPSARLFHKMVMMPDHQSAFLYGGGDENAFLGPFINDAWIFDFSTQTWRKVWDPAGNNGPDARINPALIYDRENAQVVLFAGHDDTAIGHRNDVWSFELDSMQWVAHRSGDTGAGVGCRSFCSCEPDFVDVDVNSPERRQYHSFTHLEASNSVVLFGGKSDCGYLDDTWRFELNDLSWVELDPASQGEACMRTGQEGCTDLCY